MSENVVMLITLFATFAVMGGIWALGYLVAKRATFLGSMKSRILAGTILTVSLLVLVSFGTVNIGRRHMSSTNQAIQKAWFSLMEKYPSIEKPFYFIEFGAMITALLSGVILAYPKRNHSSNN